MTITTGKGTAILKFIFLTLACSLAIVAHAADDKKAEEQQEIRKMAQDTLQRLYKAEPKAKGAVAGSGRVCSVQQYGRKDPHAWIRQGRRHRREQEQAGDVHEGGGTPGRPRIWGEEI